MTPSFATPATQGQPPHQAGCEPRDQHTNIAGKSCAGSQGRSPNARLGGDPLNQGGSDEQTRLSDQLSEVLDVSGPRFVGGAAVSSMRAGGSMHRVDVAGPCGAGRLTFMLLADAVAAGTVEVVRR